MAESELKKILASIEKECGRGTITTLDSPDYIPTEVISTGIYSLDRLLKIGGLPRGRIVEIYGPNSSGKTTLALQVIAEAQKKGLKCAFIDAEQSLDRDLAIGVGVDLGNMLFTQPDSAEQAIDITLALASSGELGVIVVDSVAALVPRAELEGDVGDAQMGLQARLMSKACRMLKPTLNKTNTLVIFINQIRYKIGVVYGNPETTPGGNALPFDASVRLDIRRIEPLKDKEGNPIGAVTKVKVVKNKFAAPFVETRFDLLYGQGSDKIAELYDIAIDKGILIAKGAWVTLDEATKWNGKDACKACLKEDEALRMALKQRISSIDETSSGEARVVAPLEE